MAVTSAVQLLARKNATEAIAFAKSKLKPIDLSLADLPLGIQQELETLSSGGAEATAGGGDGGAGSGGALGGHV